MPRHSVASDSVRVVVERLANLVASEGSVNRAQGLLVHQLAGDKSEGWIYPNRLHTLLSGDPTRAVSQETIDVVALALDRLPGAREDGGAIDRDLRASAIAAWARATSVPAVRTDEQRISYLADELR